MGSGGAGTGGMGTGSMGTGSQPGATGSQHNMGGAGQQGTGGAAGIRNRNGNGALARALERPVDDRSTPTLVGMHSRRAIEPYARWVAEVRR